MEVDWLTENLENFYMYLNGIKDNELFGNEFIKVLLEQQQYSTQLFFNAFVPFCAVMVCNIIYFSHYLPNVAVVGGFWGTEGDRF